MARTVYAKSEGEKFAADTHLAVVSCATCHVTYAIPASFYDAAKKWRGDRGDGRGWKICCPFGHTWWYVGRTTEDRLRERVRLAEEAASRNAAQRDQAVAAERGQRSAKTRIKNQRDRERQMVHAGQCPVPGCRRHFQNLAAHMERQHPDHPAAD